MNIVFFVTRYWPAVGGVEKYIRQLGRALVGMGHRVTVVAGAHQSGLPKRETHDGIEVFRYPAYRSRLRCWFCLMRWRRLFIEADVVHISDVLMVEYYYSMIAWTIPRRPLFLTRHGLSYRCPVPVSEKRRAAHVARLVDGTIDDGRFIAKWLGVPGDTVLEQGLWPPADKIEHLPEPPSNTAVFVGRLEWDTGITNYLDALVVLKRTYGISFSLDVYGGGSLEAQLRERARRDELPVTFHGFVENAQKHLADGCFAFVSGRLAIQEAMAGRRLVVATYVNELKHDYVCQEPFSPYLIASGTAGDIAEGVAYFVRHPDERARLIERAYQHAKTLTWTRTAQGYLHLWQERNAGRAELISDPNPDRASALAGIG